MAAVQWLDALDQSPMLFSGLLNRNGRVVEANQLSIEGCSLARAETIGASFWDGGWWSPDPALSRHVREWCERAVATGQSPSAVCPYFRGDGSAGMVELGLVPIIDHGIDVDPVRYVVATGLDISDLLNARGRERTGSQTRPRTAARPDVCSAMPSTR